MVWLVGAGVLVAAIGLGLLGWCILSTMRLKRASDISDAEVSAAINRLVLLNTTGLAAGFLGLGLVAAGIILA